MPAFDLLSSRWFSRPPLQNSPPIARACRQSPQDVWASLDAAVGAAVGAVETSIDRETFNVFVTESPRLVALMCELEERSLSLQWLEAQVWLNLSQDTEERANLFQEIWVQLRFARRALPSSNRGHFCGVAGVSMTGNCEKLTLRAIVLADCQRRLQGAVHNEKHHDDYVDGGGGTEENTVRLANQSATV